MFTFLAYPQQKTVCTLYVVVINSNIWSEKHRYVDYYVLIDKSDYDLCNVKSKISAPGVLNTGVFEIPVFFCLHFCFHREFVKIFWA